jgi:threonine dehydrogenase-like Zn-dependent dehydrogenase
MHLTGVKLPIQAGAPTALNWAIDSARKGGTISVVGVYGPTFNFVSIGDVLNKGLRINANQASVKRHLPRLIEHVKAGRIRPKEVITHRLALEEVAEGYHMFSSKLDNCIKTVLIPPKAA